MMAVSNRERHAFVRIPPDQKYRGQLLSLFDPFQIFRDMRIVFFQNMSLARAQQILCVVLDGWRIAKRGDEAAQFTIRQNEGQIIARCREVFGGGSRGPDIGLAFHA